MTRIAGILHRDHYALITISRSIILRVRNVSGKNCRENQNTHFMYNNFFFEHRAVYDIMWNNIVQSGRPQMAI